MGIFFNKNKKEDSTNTKEKEIRDEMLGILKYLYSDNPFEKALQKNESYKKYKKSVHSCNDTWWDSIEMGNPIFPKKSCKELIDILEANPDGNFEAIRTKIEDSKILNKKNMFIGGGKYGEKKTDILVCGINGIQDDANQPSGEHEAYEKAYWNMVDVLKEEYKKLSEKFNSDIIRLNDDESYYYYQVFILVK